MIDPFVLLTPILVLGVIGLVRFVGCLTKPPLPVDAVTVTFENLPTPSPGTNVPLDGVYANIDFGTGRWLLEGPFGPDPLNNIFFTSPGTARAFTFVNGGILVSMNVFTTTQGDLSLSNGQRIVTQTITPGSMQLVETGWTDQPAMTITVTFTSGPDLGIDTINFRD